MKTHNSMDNEIWQAMSKLGLTRVPTPWGIVEVYPRGPVWEEMAERFRESCQTVLTESNIQALIWERVRAELRGDVEVKITPTLISIAADL